MIHAEVCGHPAKLDVPQISLFALYRYLQNSAPEFYKESWKSLKGFFHQIWLDLD
jgi:hypothetical protein